MDIRLEPMTKELCRSFMQGFVVDPALFADPTKYQPYIYNESSCDAYFERYRSLGRVHFAILYGDVPIGELILKRIDREAGHCEMGISMQCDKWKNRGFGTQAERLVLAYAFETMELKTVYADSLIHNTRSQHVLEKAGFQKTHTDQKFVYYRCDKDLWSA